MEQANCSANTVQLELQPHNMVQPHVLLAPLVTTALHLTNQLLNVHLVLIPLPVQLSVRDVLMGTSVTLEKHQLLDHQLVQTDISVTQQENSQDYSITSHVQQDSNTRLEETLHQD